MDHFIARENIKHFRDLLWTDLAPEERARVQRLLVEEEDKLARSLELLDNIDRHLADGSRRIAEQRARVIQMQADGDGGVERAEALLDGMIEGQSLHLSYRRIVHIEIEKSRM